MYIARFNIPSPDQDAKWEVKQYEIPRNRIEEFMQGIENSKSVQIGKDYVKTAYWVSSTLIESNKEIENRARAENPEFEENMKRLNKTKEKYSIGK